MTSDLRTALMSAMSGWIQRGNKKINRNPGAIQSAERFTMFMTVKALTAVSDAPARIDPGRASNHRAASTNRTQSSIIKA